ncbi:MAG: hypothetical protein M0Z82_14735, partial [Actinomycetota bacterium]|nr:hypothetical protein [Actinomycetota bacterium]
MDRAHVTAPWWTWLTGYGPRDGAVVDLAHGPRDGAVVGLAHWPRDGAVVGLAHGPRATGHVPRVPLSICREPL